MRKVLLAATLTVSLNAIDIGSVFGTIASFYDPLAQIDSLSGSDTLGMCYTKDKTNFAIDVCGSLPNLNNIGFDMCSALPEISGYSKNTNTFGLSNLMDTYGYCNNVASKVNSVIGDLDIYSTEDGKTTYPNGGTTQEFYNGLIPQMLSKKSLVKTHFKNDNNEFVREILGYAKIKGLDDVTEVEIDDLTAPKDYQTYLDEREALSKLTIVDITSNTPLTVSAGVNSKISGYQGTQAKDKADEYIKAATDTVDMNTNKRVGFEVALNRKKEDLAIPTIETVNLVADEYKPETIVQIKNQMRREAKIRSKVILKDQLRKDIISLIAQKELIMNEKFDRVAAMEEIEELLKD